MRESIFFYREGGPRGIGFGLFTGLQKNGCPSFLLPGLGKGQAAHDVSQAHLRAGVRPKQEPFIQFLILIHRSFLTGEGKDRPRLSF
jgi:hypothetical protein